MLREPACAALARLAKEDASPAREEDAVGSRSMTPSMTTSPAAATSAISARAVPGPQTPPLVGGAVGVSPSFVNVAVEPSSSSEAVHQPYYSPASSPTLGQGQGQGRDRGQGVPLPTSPMPEVTKETRKKKRRQRKSREEGESD